MTRLNCWSSILNLRWPHRCAPKRHLDLALATLCPDCAAQGLHALLLFIINILNTNQAAPSSLEVPYAQSIDEISRSNKNSSNFWHYHRTVIGSLTFARCKVNSWSFSNTRLNCSEFHEVIKSGRDWTNYFPQEADPKVEIFEFPHNWTTQMVLFLFCFSCSFASSDF